MKKAGVFILLALILLQCETSSSDCSTPATVRNLTGLDGCGWVFELADGTRLEPQMWMRCGTSLAKIEEDPLLGFEFAEGKKVLIRYEEVTDIASICMVGPIVKITCLEEVVSFPDE